MDRKTVKMCSVVRVSVSAALGKINLACHSRVRDENKCKNVIFFMVWWCISATHLNDLHMCEGTTDKEAYIGMLETSPTIKEPPFPGR